jgi:hypothetical protein
LIAIDSLQVLDLLRKNRSRAGLELQVKLRGGELFRSAILVDIYMRIHLVFGVE